MTVAGDWTACGLDAGCVEAAVMSGMLAAHRDHRRHNHRSNPSSGTTTHEPPRQPCASSVHRCSAPRPDRGAANFYRSASDNDAAVGGVPLDSVEAAVVAAVRMGYKIAAEQIDRTERHRPAAAPGGRQGRRRRQRPAGAGCDRTTGVQDADVAVLAGSRDSPMTGQSAQAARGCGIPDPRLAVRPDAPRRRPRGIAAAMTGRRRRASARSYAHAGLTQQASGSRTRKRFTRKILHKSQRRAVQVIAAGTSRRQPHQGSTRSPSTRCSRRRATINGIADRDAGRDARADDHHPAGHHPRHRGVRAICHGELQIGYVEITF